MFVLLIRSKCGMYQCEELDPFICWCIDTVERFTGKSVAEVFNTFIEKYVINSAVCTIT